MLRGKSHNLFCSGICINSHRDSHVGLTIHSFDNNANLCPFRALCNIRVSKIAAFGNFLNELIQLCAIIVKCRHKCSCTLTIFGTINFEPNLRRIAKQIQREIQISLCCLINTLACNRSALCVVFQFLSLWAICIDRAHHLSFCLSLRGRWGITAAGGEQNKYHGRRQNQSGQFFSAFSCRDLQSFCCVFIIICRVPFHFETGPLPALFYPTTVAFVNCQLHQTFSPAFVVFSRTNLRKDPLPCPGQKPENISGVYTILPRFGAKLKAMGTAGCRS